MEGKKERNQRSYKHRHHSRIRLSAADKKSRTILQHPYYFLAQKNTYLCFFYIQQISVYYMEHDYPSEEKLVNYYYYCNYHN
jgi:hypothetical protein